MVFVSPLRRLARLPLAGTFIIWGWTVIPEAVPFL